MKRRDTSLALRSQIVILKREQNYSNREIARRLGISPNTVARWIARDEESGVLTDLRKYYVVFIH